MKRVESKEKEDGLKLGGLEYDKSERKSITVLGKDGHDDSRREAEKYSCKLRIAGLEEMGNLGRFSEVLAVAALINYQSLYSYTQGTRLYGTHHTKSDSFTHEKKPDSS